MEVDAYMSDLQNSIETDICIIDSVFRQNEKKEGFVHIISEYIANCPSSQELHNTLLKRLGNRVKSSIAIWCICSYGYTINHISVPAFTLEDFRSIWCNIETLKISSSPLLASWIKECVGRRSQEGYSMKFSTVERRYSVYNSSLLQLDLNLPLVEIDTSIAEAHFGSPTTISSAIAADTKLLSYVRLVSGEPILKNDTINKYF